MLTEFQKRKLTVQFHQLDLNNDGILELADYEECARKACEVLGFSPGSPECDLVYTRTVEDRKFLFKDKAKRTVDDFLKASDHTIHDEALFNKLLVEYSQSMLELWDQDDDKRLSADEYVKLEWCYGVTEEEAREAFRHLDRDGDGYLTLEEIMKAIKEFYLSDDPDAPGNWLFGPY